MTVGLLFRLEATWGSEDELAALLDGELRSTLDELPLTASFAVRFGPTSFGLFAVFADEAGRAAHVGERIAAALRAHEDLLAATPAVEGFDVVAATVAGQAVSP